jgi:hypothetical protein
MIARMEGSKNGGNEAADSLGNYLRRRPITIEAIGSAATHPSLRGALATKQSRGANMRGGSNPDGRTAAPGLLRFANKKPTVTALILLEKLCTEKEKRRHRF